MATRIRSKKRERAERKESGITRITVAGFKSIRDEQSIDIRPLTILAGANSSGKSSMLQPLLLLKQTLECPYDPGPLLLNGPNVRFTDAQQFFSRNRNGEPVPDFSVSIRSPTFAVETSFRRRPRSGLDVRKTVLTLGKRAMSFNSSMSGSQVWEQVKRGPEHLVQFFQGFAKGGDAFEWQIVRDRCFLNPSLRRGQGERVVHIPFLSVSHSPAEQVLVNVVHIPGMRGNPARVYPVTALEDSFPGLFPDYVASVISQWETDRSDRILHALHEDLRLLGLTWKVTAKRISDAEVELQVGRLTRAVRAASRDLVNIADVGFGLSQVLPVMVAVHAAGPDNLLYLEQPEIHLHPRAQVAMATVLARAVRRGVRMVVETHSGLLLRAVQAVVAEGKEALTPDLVKLHWFTRSEKDGTTTIASAELDEAGAFGDWPEDFGDVELDIESRYLDAAQSRMSKK